MIPKILHQVWVGPEPLPERHLALMAGWRALHPDWEHRLWTDADLTGWVGELVRAARVPASQADVVRIHAVRTFGGVYADVDFEWNHSLDSLLHHSAFACRSRRGHVVNALFGATAGHPVLEWMWERLPKWVVRSPPWGPRLLTTAIEAVGNVEVLPHTMFYPTEWDEPTPQASDYPDSIAVHLYDHSWKGQR